YPLGANSAVGACKPILGSGIQNPALRRPLVIAGSQKRRHGTGGGFFLPRAGHSLKSNFFFCRSSTSFIFNKKSAVVPNPLTDSIYG
ncbi:MAG TPA: hypothetical protein VMF69_28850, partial [Gemmataceae bacterium]|nr:hypothetical protein [Gemmataceae bacterium]